MPSDEKKPAADAATPVEQPAPPAAPAQEDSLDGSANAAAPPPAPEGEPAGDKTPKPKKRIPGLKNIWLIVYILFVLGAVAVVILSVKTSKPTTTVTKAGSLTDQQLSSLKGNTTLVGDSKQTIDIQGSSIFEGAVLARSDVSIAGALKVGSGISIPSITVGGSGTFGQIGISGGLNVGGDAQVQGQLTVQKNLTVSGAASFGNLNVSTLSVTSLQLRGDININQHIIASGGNPGRSVGTAVGGGGTASVSGSDTAGTVAINTGSNPPAGCFITVNFTKSFGATPHVVISPSNSQAAGLQYYTNRTSGGFSVCSAGVPAGATNYVFDYIVIN
jgi:hypothetical protein